jgi:hypothetical protein
VTTKSTKAQNETIEEEVEDDYAGECIYKKSGRQIAQTFPFSQSDKIELVSYKDREDRFLNDELIKDGTFIVPNISDRKQLDSQQIDSLFSILYNFKTKNNRNEEFGADCYEPHHSVVFYETGRAIAFYEICFSCGGTRQTPGTDFGQFCEEKLCMLQRFFRQAKIEKEIIDEMCE